MPWVTCGQEKGVPANKIHFPRGINLSRQKTNAFICLINHAISPLNIYITFYPNT